MMDARYADKLTAIANREWKADERLTRNIKIMDADNCKRPIRHIAAEWHLSPQTIRRILKRMRNGV